MNKYIWLNEKDNVIVALKDIKKNEKVNNLTVNEDIHQGHKIAIKDIKCGERVFKYGYAIGVATKNIKPGDHVHTHNVKTLLDTASTYHYDKNVIVNKFSFEDKKVLIYKRSNGKYGIRNNILILPLVGCINSTVLKIKEEFVKRYSLEGIDDVVAITHPYGCSQIGDDMMFTKETLASIALHPNFGGVLIVSLGCENNQLKPFLDCLGDYDKTRIKSIVIQDAKDDIEDSIKLLDEIYSATKNDSRTETPLSNITIGLKCGGSDGLSGITANPLVGMISDYLVMNGASSILTEVPEMFGAEQVLMNRCKDENTYNKTLKMINDFKDYYKNHNQVCYENPSPGNKEGGITTLKDKSLGCIQKSGYSEVVDVLKENQKVVNKGLNLLNGPGNDIVSTTNLVCSDANLILFTTGRGTPFGSIVPTIKVSSNSLLFNKKEKWIDYNAGSIVDGKPFDDAFNELLDLVIKTINGEYKTKNETNKLYDIAIFKDGVTL